MGDTPAQDGRNGDEPKTEAAEEAERRAEVAHERKVETIQKETIALTEPALDARRLHLLQIQWVRDLLVVALIFGLFYLGYILSPVTVPMLLALGLAYLVEPVVSRVVKRGWFSRTGAAATVVAIIVLTIAIPVTLGVGFAAVQGVEYTDRFQDNIQKLVTAINEPTEENANQIPRGTWRGVFNFIWGVQKGLGETTPGGAPAEAGEGAPTGGDKTPPGTEGGAPAGVNGAGVGTVVPGAGGEAQEETGPPGAEVVVQEGPPAPTRSPGTRGSTGGGLGSLKERGAELIDTWLKENTATVGQYVGREFLGAGGNIAQVAWRVLVSIAYALFALFLVLFFFFFFSTGWEKVLHSMTDLIPKWKRNRTIEMVRQMDLVIAGFIRGRLIIMLIMIVLFVALYWLVGVPAPLLVGVGVGVLSLVPYLSMIGIPIAIGLMVFQAPEGGAEWMGSWWWILLGPTGVYFLVQTIDDYVLTPMIQGKTTQMDTPSILFAVLAGGILLGFYGVLLAIPLAACLKILLRESFWPRFKAWAEGKVKDFLPISRYDPVESKLPAPTAVEVTKVAGNG